MGSVRQGLTGRAVKALGVMLEERNIAQVSINMCDYKQTPLYRVLEFVRFEAARYGVHVVGTEIIGLVPKKSLLDAGRFYLERQGLSSDLPEEEIIQVAVRSISLDDLRPFDPREKVIEYRIQGG